MKKLLPFIILCSILLLSADPPQWEPVTGTEFSMVVFARIAHADSFFACNNSNIAAAFGPEGDDDCRALAGWQEYDPLGFWFFNIVGDLNDEDISFKIYDSNADSVLQCSQTIAFVDNATIGSPSEPWLLSVQASIITGNVSLITTSLPAGDVSQMNISTASFSVSPNPDGFYQLPAQPGVHNVTASLDGYNPETLPQVIVEPDIITDNIDFHLIDWETVTGTQYNMVLMAQVMINGQPFTSDGYNHLAAFGSDNDDDCRGVAAWQYANPPYWDGYWFFTIVSNTLQQDIRFRLYDHSSHTVYSCEEVIQFENDTTIGSPDDPFILNADLDVQQSIPLGDSWNWISFNVHPADSLIASVFEPLTPHVYQIKNQSQSATYYQNIPIWLGDLQYISDGESYLVYMNQPVVDFSISGIPVFSGSPIPLNMGWNWVAYYPQFAYDLDTALYSITPQVIQVKTQSQSANYIDPPGQWTGNLWEMLPGTGYKIDMQQSAQLVYGLQESAPTPQDDDITDDPPLWEVISGTQYSMVLMAEILLDNIPFTAQEDNLAAAFGSQNEDDCRSIAMWQNPNPPHYDGFWYFTIVGDLIGEDISFKIYDYFADSIYTADFSLQFADNETLGTPDEPLLLEFSSQSYNDNAELIPASSITSIFPNPFNPSVNIDLYMAKNSTATIDIYNLKGQKITSICDDKLNSGAHSLVWNAPDCLPSGIYLLKFSFDNCVTAKKIILMK